MLAGGVSPTKRWMRLAFLLVAFIFLIITLTQPRLGYEEREIKSHGRDVMLVIDVSRSMLATDVAPTRLARAQLLAQDALSLLPGDRIGLIAFEGRAFLEAPLTLDHSAVRDALSELDISLIPKGGTNIADAIQTAIAAFGKSEGNSCAIILITDGEELEQSGVTAAKEAATQGVKIFTIGMGSAEGSLIPVKNQLGNNDFVRDEHGKPVLSKLDVARLKEIASITGGFYEPFGTNAVRTIVEKGIMPLTASDNSSLHARRPIERYEWPLSVALFFLICWSLFDERRHNVISSQAKKISVFLIALGFLTAQGKAASGIAAYQQGNYQDALQDFERQLGSGSHSEALRFDAGAAAYQHQDYKKAAAYFTGAMTSSSQKIQQAATYNLANTLVRQGESSQTKEEKLSDWNNAIQHYETVLRADPNNKNAQENRDLVKKMIEKLKQEKEPEPPQSQSQQAPNDQQKNQNKSDQNKNNQQDQKQEESDSSKKSDTQQPPPPSNPGSGAGNGTPPPSSQNSSPKTEENPSSSSQDKKEEQQSQQQKSEQSQQQQSQSQPSSSSQQNQSSQEQGGIGQKDGSASPTPKKEGALGGGEQGKQDAAAAAEEGTNGMMSPSQAEAVLRSMEDEERRVQFQQHKDFEETTRDW